MYHNWVRITVFVTIAAFLAIALIALQSAQTTSATEFAPASPTTLFIESDSECSGAADDNGNGVVNEGCPLVGIVAESGGQCTDAADALEEAGATPDAVNDGCPGVSRVGTSETPDTTSLFSIPKPSAQFSGAVTYTDSAFTIDEHGAGADLPLGAIIGLVDSTATLGLINGSCSSVLLVPLTMMNASTDITDTIDPDGPPDNLLLPLAEDINNNKLADVVDKYPSYLNTIFDKGDGTSLEPRFRYVGVQDVSGLIVILNLVGFDEGELRKLPGGGGAISSLGTSSVTVLQDPTQAASNSAVTDFCSNLTTNVNLLGVSNDNACTPTLTTGCTLGVTTSLGSKTIFKGVDGGDSGGESGSTRMTAPGTGVTAVNTQQFGSARDFDGDGIENSLDPCHSTHSGSWDPRVTIDFLNDPDVDGLDNSCDPTPNSAAADHDIDQYPNRLDNCALLPNGDTSSSALAAPGATSISVVLTTGFAIGNDIQIDSGTVAERRTITAIGASTLSWSAGNPLVFSHPAPVPVAQIFLPLTNFGQSDRDIAFPIPVPDGGPRADVIGPACDHTVTIAGETLSPTIPNGHYHRAATIARGCVLGTDADGDGVCAGFIQIPAISTPESGGDCIDAADNDGDGAAGDGCAENDGNSDTDGDGVPDGVDNCLNTDNAASSGFTQGDVDADGKGDACETVNSTTNTNDNDGDGFSNTLEGIEDPLGSGLAGLSECGNAIDDDSDGDVNDGCPTWGTAESACGDAVDSDRDLYVNDGCIANGAAESSDGISTGIELHCASNSLDTVGSYPPDIDGDSSITSGDLGLVAGPIGTSTVAGGGATPDRRDIAPEPVSDNSITAADLGAVAAVIGTGC